jgi:DNA-binding ferritin-like protein
MKTFSEIKRKRIFEQEISLEKPEQKEPTKSLDPLVSQTQDLTQSKEETKSEPAKFFSKIFESRQMAHVYHLQVKGDMGSHAAHTALNEYYDELLEFLDEIIEVYQGQYGIIENYEMIDTKDTNSKDKIEYFLEFIKFIKETRKSTFSDEDTHLHNIIDEIVALTYKLIYKLKFNK